MRKPTRRAAAREGHQVVSADPGRTVRVRKPTRRTAAREGHQVVSADPGRTVRVRKPTRRTAAREGHRVVSADPGRTVRVGKPTRRRAAREGRLVVSAEPKGVEKEKSREGKRTGDPSLSRGLCGSGGTFGLGAEEGGCQVRIKPGGGGKVGITGEI